MGVQYAGNTIEGSVLRGLFFIWVAVKELKLSWGNPIIYYIYIYAHYGNLIQVPQQQPSHPGSRAPSLGLMVQA